MQAGRGYGCRARRSGSMPAGPVLRPVSTRGTQRVNWTVRAGIKQIPVANFTLSEIRSPTVSVSMTCTATFGNGWRMTRIRTMRERRMTVVHGLMIPEAPLG